MAYHLQRIPEATCYLIAQGRFHLRLRDVLERRQDRVLDLALNRHLDDAGRVLRQLIGDELQDLLLSGKVRRLLANADLFEALVYT